MAVTIQINGTTLDPQPQMTSWSPMTVATKLNGTESLGGYKLHTLTAPPDYGGTAYWNWSSFENAVLTSIQTHSPLTDMVNGSATTYNSGVVSKPIRQIETTPGGIVRSVILEILVIV